MHDIRTIRENPEAFDAGLRKRGAAPASAEVLALDVERRELISQAETAQAEANRAAKEIGAAKAAGDEDRFNTLRAEQAQAKAAIAEMSARADEIDSKLRDVMLGLPNLPLDGVPEGLSEDDNVEIKRWGTPRDIPNAAEHFDIPAARHGMDFETAARLSGARFVVLQGGLARLHRALGQFMLDLHIDQHGLTETWTPVLVLPEMMLGTGQLPKFGEDSYQTRDGWWLIPTSEVTLTNTVNGQTIDEATLPRRMVAHSQCFRSEAGSAGRDTKGMIRQHQFEKVEMVSITAAGEGVAELDAMTARAEAVLEALELPYRTMQLCAGDMGAAAQSTRDLEVWLPGQNRYREISSVSYVGDFQGRRMNARYRPEGGGKPVFVETLNGSGLAVGRTLVAVLENGQQPDGSVRLPQVLTPWLGGRLTLGADGNLSE